MNDENEEELDELADTYVSNIQLYTKDSIYGIIKRDLRGNECIIAKDSFKAGYNKALEELKLKSMLLHLIKEDKEFREKIIETLRYDKSFIRAVGEAYQNYDISRRLMRLDIDLK